ncbi:MAG TPA: hypothetical protein VMH00_01180 [Candidatus Limnocylindrales bacterium]|nr:hypothetical protein [Candidatus Limnocylindrales bacterium]
MRDWRRLVAERLDRTDLPTSQKDEVATELAGHLEDVCESRCREGSSEDEAVAVALNEVVNWHDLGRRIAKAKRKETTMNDRTRKFWMPGFASLGSAVIFQAAVAYLSYRPGAILHSSSARWAYAAWLVAQVACGAIGAYLSRRAGGQRLARIGAALTTSTVLMTVMVIVGAFNLLMYATGIWPNHGVGMQVFGRDLGIVVMIPAIALLVGAAPFLPERKGAIGN